MTQTVVLSSNHARQEAARLMGIAPPRSIVKIKPPGRSLDQNAKMWAMLSDISRAKPEGRKHTPEIWKCLFMQAAGHAVQFEVGLDNTPFPVGFSSSRLSKAQMVDLIEFMYEYGSRHNVKWSEE